MSPIQLIEPIVDIDLRGRRRIGVAYHPETTVRTAYDLKPCHRKISGHAKGILNNGQLTSMTISVIRMVATPIQPHALSYHST